MNCDSKFRCITFLPWSSTCRSAIFLCTAVNSLKILTKSSPFSPEPVDKLWISSWWNRNNKLKKLGLTTRIKNGEIEYTRRQCVLIGINRWRLGDLRRRRGHGEAEIGGDGESIGHPSHSSQWLLSHPSTVTAHRHYRSVSVPVQKQGCNSEKQRRRRRDCRRRKKSFKCQMMGTEF